MKKTYLSSCKLGMNTMRNDMCNITTKNNSGLNEPDKIKKGNRFALQSRFFKGEGK